MKKKVIIGAIGAAALAAHVLAYAPTYEATEQYMERIQGKHIHSLDDALKVMPSDSAEAVQRAKEILAWISEEKQKMFAISAQDRTYKNTVWAYNQLKAMYYFYDEVTETYESVASDIAHRSDAHDLLGKEKAALFMDAGFYHAFKEYKDNQMLKDELSEEEQYFFDDCMQEFEADGYQFAFTDPDRFALIQKLQSECNDLGNTYSKNIALDNSFIEVDEADLGGVDPDFVAKQERTDDGKVVLRCNYPTMSAVSGYCETHTVRRALAEAFSMRAAPQNVAVLEDLISKRHELAVALGFESFAHYALVDKMAKTPEKATEFLQQLYTVVKEKAQKEHDARMDWFKEQQAHGKMSDIVLHQVTSLDGKEVEQFLPGDGAYVSAKYVKDQFDYDGREVAKYFPIKDSINAVFKIYEKFMNLEFEQFDEVSGAWHEDVTAISVKEGGKVVGYIFLDLYPRPNKYGHACCASLTARMADDRDSKSVCVVIANFQKDPAHLRHREVQTFFHEFGHAIHAILGNTKMLWTTGNHVKRDFVELPSQILEDWMWDREMLKMVSKHYKTGEPLSEEWLDKIETMRTLSSGGGVVGQVYLSMLSLAFFGPGAQKDTVQIMKDLLAQYSPYSYWHDKNRLNANFGHLIGYHAGYYGYQLARAYACDVFEQIKDNDGLLAYKPWGEKFVESILRPGGSRDPHDLLERFLGRAPTYEAAIAAYARHVGTSS